MRTHEKREVGDGGVDDCVECEFVENGARAVPCAEHAVHPKVHCVQERAQRRAHNRRVACAHAKHMLISSEFIVHVFTIVNTSCSQSDVRQNSVIGRIFIIKERTEVIEVEGAEGPLYIQVLEVGVGIEDLAIGSCRSPLELSIA